MRASLGFALVFALALVGCTASPTLERLRGDVAPAQPYYREWHEDVNGTHEKRFEFPVTERSTSIDVTLRLSSRAPTLDASPARLTIQVLSPHGATLGNATIDAAHPTFHFATKDLADNGDYIVAVAGEGVSGALQGQGYGASYTLTVEVPEE